MTQSEKRQQTCDSIIMSSNDGTTKTLNIGAKIACYWPNDDLWYEGTVEVELGNDRFWIKYNNGIEREMSIKEDKWRRSTYYLDDDEQRKKRAIVNELEPGSRIAIYFPHEKEYHNGTLTKKRDADSAKGPHHIRYDDGDKEWTDLMFRKFKNLAESRVTVDYDEAVKIEPDNVRSHEFRYDEDSREEQECPNLQTRPSSDIKVEQHDTIQQRQQTSVSIMSSNDRRTSNPLVIGTKIACYWPDDDHWYKGSVSDQLDDERFWIKYDDGGEGAMNIKVDKWRRSLPAEDEKEKEAIIAELEPGSRIAVYFPHEKEYYAGTLLTKKKKVTSQNGPHRIRYDDGDEEWTDLLFRKFQNIPKNADQLEVGSRVAVYDESKTKTYHATVVKIKPEQARPHEVKYDKKGKGKEWLNLYVHPFLDMSVELDEKNKRKEEFADTDRPLKKQRLPHDQKGLEEAEESQEAARYKQSKQCNLKAGELMKKRMIPVEQVDLETGDIIATFPSMKRAHEATGVDPRVIKRVLERRGKANGGGYFWRNQGETHDPWPDPEEHPQSFWKPVEQLDWETGVVMASYESHSEAKRKICMLPTRSCIRQICNGLYGRETAGGFFWRWKGSDSLPRHLKMDGGSEARGTSRVIEISKERNGNVVKVFKTAKDAQAFIGHLCSQRSISRHCQFEDFYLGYYWRYQVPTRSPPLNTDEELIGKRLRVKQPGRDWLDGKINGFCSESGEHEILFDCGKLERQCLSKVEFEWKESGYERKPVEQLDLQSGAVLASFNSIQLAARSIQNDSLLVCRAKFISRVCNGRGISAYGYFWRFKGSTDLPKENSGNTKKKKVDQLCLKTGRVITTFDSITSATNAIGKSRLRIVRCCNKNIPSVGGFGWRFSKEEDDDCSLESISVAKVEEV